MAIFNPATDGSQPDEPMGFGVYPYFEVFDETFHKSAFSDFKKFFKDNSAVTKWMAFTDYAFYDKNKNSDVVAYTFLPYISEFDEAYKSLERLSFKDVKKLSKINPEFITFIKNAPILNIAIFLGRNRKISFHKENESLLFAFDSLLRMVEEWKRNAPEHDSAPTSLEKRIEHYDSIQKDLRVVCRELKQQSANLRLLRDIYIVSSLSAYLMFEAAQAIDIDKIGWFSDRDGLLSYKASQLEIPTIFNLTSILYHCLCENKGVDSKNNPVFGVPERDGTLWYDPFLRIPDLICATFADMNLITGEFSHQKFAPVLSELILSNKKLLTFEIRFSKNGNEAVRRTFDKRDATT